MEQMDDFANLGRLEEEQIKALKSTEESLEKWSKFHDDYKALQDRLKTLPDQVTHEVMVPFGPMGFMPGHLQHTNEIMVLLGDNWFAERSAKQAAEIVERRLKTVNKQLDDLRSQQNLLLSRREFTGELRETKEAKSDVFEIKEPFDADQERKWRERHREYLKARKKKTVVETKPEVVESPEDADLWRRLDELELQEKENRELERLPDVDPSSLDLMTDIPLSCRVAVLSSSHVLVAELRRTQNGRPREKTSQTVTWSIGKRLPDVDPSDLDFMGDIPASGNRRDSTDSAKKVKWKDEEGSSSSGGSGYEEDSEGSAEESSASRPNTIEIHHTPSTEITHDSDVPEDESTTDIKSPADIYKYFGHASNPKSILKEPSLSFPSHPIEAKPPDVKEKVILPGSTSAFSGTIVERASSDSTKVCDTEQPKRVSKFKAQRQQMKR